MKIMRIEKAFQSIKTIWALSLSRDNKQMIRVMSKAHLRPNKKLGRREVQLVTFDLPFLSFYYSQRLMVYKGCDYTSMVRRLKDGLGVVLEDFYPLAGRLVQNDGVFMVRYDDDDDGNGGVEVSEATAEEISVDDITDQKLCDVSKAMIPYNGVRNLEGWNRSLLAIQFTKLKDGIAIGCAFNHGVVDGTSTWHFISSWAEISRGATTLSAVPFHDRIKARNTTVKLILPPPPSSTTTDASAAPPLTTAGQITAKIFHFSEQSIHKIKSNLNASNTSKHFSTFQSLSVHIWRAITRARGLSPEAYTVFAVFADCRNRINPPAPETYFGNLIQAMFTATTTELLTKNPPQFGATLIQSSIENHDASAINERNAKFENEPRILGFQDAGVNSVVVASSPKFRFYDVDFGFGKPDIVRIGLNNRFDGMVYLCHGKSGGRSIDVELSLEAATMNVLEEDELFKER